MSPVALAVALVLVAGAAATGARFQPGAWYRALEKPAWNPPAWLFAPVWTLLYAAMALAAWFAWREGRGPLLAVGLGLWLAQLFANAAWSWLFFGRHRPGRAAADIGLLLVLLVATTAVFFRISPVAGWLLVPYLAWAGFAGCLNLSLWRRNRERLRRG